MESIKEVNKHVVKTGTLTMGVICKEGIVLSADRRTTYAEGKGVFYIAGKAEQKIHRLNERLIVTIAGVASDVLKIIKLISAEIRLKELRTKEKISVEEAANLLSNIVYQHIRTPSMIPGIAHFLLAGYDDSGVSLYDISPDGKLSKITNYAASGAPFQAHAVLDSDYRENMTIPEGAQLVTKAFKATIEREPSVGGGFDIFTIKKGEIKRISDQDLISELKDN